MKKSLLFLIALIISFQVSQADEFSLEKYHEFLSEHEDISSSQLYEMYPPGQYVKK